MHDFAGERVAGDRATVWHLGRSIITNELIDVAVGCSEVLPYFAGGTLSLYPSSQGEVLSFDTRKIGYVA